jgi:hypothetical protein
MDQRPFRLKDVLAFPETRLNGKLQFNINQAQDAAIVVSIYLWGTEVLRGLVNSLVTVGANSGSHLHVYRIYMCLVCVKTVISEAPALFSFVRNRTFVGEYKAKDVCVCYACVQTAEVEFSAI